MGVTDKDLSFPNRLWYTVFEVKHTLQRLK